MAIDWDTILVPRHVIKSLQLTWRSGTHILWVPDLQMSCRDLTTWLDWHYLIKIICTKSINKDSFRQDYLYSKQYFQNNQANLRRVQHETHVKLQARGTKIKTCLFLCQEQVHSITAVILNDNETVFELRQMSSVSIYLNASVSISLNHYLGRESNVLPLSWVTCRYFDILSLNYYNVFFARWIFLLQNLIKYPTKTYPGNLGPI